MKKAITPLTSQPTQTGKNTIDKAFGLLKLQYPNFLNDQPEIETKRVWFAHLSEFSADRIERAIKLAPDRYPTFPPTIGEIKALIREDNHVASGSAITMSPTCSNCHADRRTQHHYDSCVKK